MTALAFAAPAEGQASLEYAVKAAYLTKFAPFIDWPDGAFASPGAPVTICILGNDPFGATLDKAAASGGGSRPIAIRRLAANDPAEGCQIVFTGDADAALDGLRGKPVVTVTDSSTPAHGIISFVMQDNHVRFDIDDAGAETSGLRISSKLLELAHNVSRRPRPCSGTGQRWNWPITAALAAAVLLLLAGIGMARYEDELYAAQQTRDVAEQAEILAASVTAAVSFNDNSAAQEYVDALEANPELRAAGVYDARGKLFAQFSRGGQLPATIGGADLKTQGATVNGDAMTVTAPVVEDGKAIGAVAIISTTEPAQRRIARYAGLVLLVTMGALVIGVLAFSQAALSRRAAQLSAVNIRLQAEMAERQKTEEALRQSHKMEAVGQLSGGIAHDFNNLIMIAKSNLRMLQKKTAVGATGGYVVSAENALDRAAGLTQRILAFSRRQPLSPQPVRLSELVAGMDELLRHSVGEGVKIETRLSARWWTVCDVNQMENVILNLAINARDAMANGGTLTIETRDVALKSAPPDVSEFVPGDYVALLVRDTGEGMSPDVRQRALDPFFTTKPQGKGTGLGLSMTFGYVRQSNGYLVIESAPGQGTTIAIYMPRRAEKTA